MRKHLHFFMVVISCVFLAGCKEQRKNERLENSISQRPGKLHVSLASVKVIDTIFTPNAPSKITRTIKQDKKGNLWIASWDDIIKYDGSSFTNITSKVSSSRFFSVLEDQKGNFWFASIGSGVYYYNGKSFQNFTTKEGLVNNIVTNIHEAKNGNIWFSTEGGISCYDGTSFRNFTTEQGLCNNDVNCIIEDQAGKFWIGTRGTACTYNPSSATFTKIMNTGGQPFENVRHIIKDKKGNIWLGGKDGLWQYNQRLFTNFSNDFVGYIYEDRKGNIWTSSKNSGSNVWVLSCYEKDYLINKIATANEIMSEKGMLFGISEDKEGNIWAGTLQGLFTYDGKSIQYYNDVKL